jgi:hypothetical protein
MALTLKQRLAKAIRLQKKLEQKQADKKALQAALSKIKTLRK